MGFRRFLGLGVWGCKFRCHSNFFSMTQRGWVEGGRRCKVRFETCAPGAVTELSNTQKMPPGLFNPARKALHHLPLPSSLQPRTQLQSPNCQEIELDLDAIHELLVAQLPATLELRRVRQASCRGALSCRIQDLGLGLRCASFRFSSLVSFWCGSL